MSKRTDYRFFIHTRSGGPYELEGVHSHTAGRKVMMTEVRYAMMEAKSLGLKPVRVRLSPDCYEIRLGGKQSVTIYQRFSLEAKRR